MWLEQTFCARCNTQAALEDCCSVCPFLKSHWWNSIPNCNSLSHSIHFCLHTFHTLFTSLCHLCTTPLRIWFHERSSISSDKGTCICSSSRLNYEQRYAESSNDDAYSKSSRCCSDELIIRLGLFNAGLLTRFLKTNGEVVHLGTDEATQMRDERGHHPEDAFVSTAISYAHELNERVKQCTCVYKLCRVLKFVAERDER